MRQRGTNNNEHCNLIQVVLDPDLIKVQLEWHLRAYQNTCLCKLSWNPLQWTWHDLYTGQGSKGIPFFQFTTRLGCYIIAAQTDRESDAQRYDTHIVFPIQLLPSFSNNYGNNNTIGELPYFNDY